MLYSNQVRCTILPQRVVLAIMGFFGILVSFTMRACLSIAITEMVTPETIQIEIHNDSSYCPADFVSFDDIKRVDSNSAKFNWSEEQQGWILSAYYFGYVASHIPGALLAQKYGGKWTFAFEILTITVCNVLIPPALLYGGENALVLLIILRILMGIGTGPQFPTVLVLLAAWTPRNESGKLGTLCLSGSVIGIVLSFFVSGLILSIWTWPVIFYFWSILGVIWFIMFILLCYSDPASHPFITKEERDYLASEIGQLQREKTLPPTPWKSILTSVPVIALVITQIGSDVLDFVYGSDIPKYMSDVLRFPVWYIGIFTSLPYLLKRIVSMLSGTLCDYLVSHQYISLTHARKIFSALAGYFPATFLLLASYAGCDKTVFIICLMLTEAFKSNDYPGMTMNALDLSPNYAGPVFSIVNGCGSVMGFIVPIFVGIMTPESTLEQWRIVFWTVFGISILRTTTFLIWGSAEIQPWNEPNNCDKRSNANELNECENTQHEF